MPRRGYLKPQARDRGNPRVLISHRKRLALAASGISSVSLPGFSIHARPVYFTSVLTLIAILAGWQISAGNAAVVAAAVLIPPLLVVAPRFPGPAAAVLLLAVMNGVPVVNLSGRLPAGAHFQDGAVFLLAALLYARRDPRKPAAGTRFLRAASVWSACFTALWAFTVARSWLLEGVPVLKAALFGRDFLYFAILLPFALRASIPARSLLAGGRILLLGVSIYAAATAVVSLTGVTLPWLIHPIQADVESGLTRVYSLMPDLANTCLIFGVAFLLSQSACGRRWTTGAFTLLLLLASLLQLTRATYFSLAVAFLGGTYVYVAHYASGATFLVRGAVAVLVLLTFALSLSGLTGGTTAGGSPVRTVVTRVQTGLSDLSQSTGTVGYREQVDQEMLHVLGRRWPIGLGFLHPSARYIALLPSGAIRNPDTGVFNILMTMGVAGLLLLYAPLVYALRRLLRSSGSSSHFAPLLPQWVACGGVAWIAWVIAGSPTLVELFSVSGLVLTALVLASLGHTYQACRLQSSLASRTNRSPRVDGRARSGDANTQ
jgi:hypothetical protein